MGGHGPNGSLTQDRNKGLTGIAYNHLNLPRLIHFGSGADSLVFRYTASGQKVAKLVYQTGQPVRRTDYLGPFQYEQDYAALRQLRRGPLAAVLLRAEAQFQRSLSGRCTGERRRAGLAPALRRCTARG